MATITEQPFRFLDLPAELRRMVYQELFDPSYFIVDLSCWCIKVSPGPGKCHKDEPKPGILMACKSIRQEALPVFSASLTPMAFNPDPRASFSLAPAHYLRHCKTAFINDRSKTVPTLAELPSLQTLIVHFCWDFQVGRFITGAPGAHTNSIVSDEEIIDELLIQLNLSDIAQLLEDNQTEALLPANVLMECELKISCTELCGGRAWYDNIMLDMKREPPALVSKVRKRRFEHGQGCRWFREEDKGVQDKEVEKVELVGRWADGAVFCAREVGEGYDAHMSAEYDRMEAEGRLDEW